jgi:2,4-dienoyl-CoA reductase-like NADH-dependent reductase (Old Yellow Enzyme family)
VKRQAGIHTMAVGLILDGPQAEAILQAGDADLIAIGRQALFDPFWALHAAQELGCDADFAMWTPEYGWWLDKRKNNLVDIKK